MIVGFLVLSGIGIAITVAYIEILYQRRRDKIYGEALAVHQSNLRNYSLWFKEDPKTMKLIQALAQGRSIEAIRQDWKKDVKG